MSFPCLQCCMHMSCHQHAWLPFALHAENCRAALCQPKLFPDSINPERSMFASIALIPTVFLLSHDYAQAIQMPFAMSS